MTRTCSAKISPNDCTAGNNGLSSKNDVLRSGYGSSSRDFVSCVLVECQQLIDHGAAFSAYGFDEFSLGIIYWRFHRGWMTVATVEPSRIRTRRLQEGCLPSLEVLGSD